MKSASVPRLPCFEVYVHQAFLHLFCPEHKTPLEFGAVTVVEGAPDTWVRPMTRVIGKAINWRVLVADNSSHLLDASEQAWKEWTDFDTFDMLSPQYDKPATLNEFLRRPSETRLANIDASYGYKGIEGRGQKPAAAATE